MNDKEREAQFLEQARSALDQEAESLDAATASRLKRARYEALEQYDPPHSGLWRLIRVPAAAVAAGIIIAAVIFTNPRYPAPIQNGHSLSDLEILQSEEQFDLLTDFDFYYWLAETGEYAG